MGDSIYSETDEEKAAADNAYLVRTSTACAPPPRPREARRAGSPEGGLPAASYRERAREQPTLSATETCARPSPQTDHGINDLMKQLVSALIRDQPLHPLQYMIDLLQEGAAGATQDKFGLNKHRRERIITIFEAVDKDGSGFVSLSEYKQFLNVESGSMEEEELNAAFREMDSGDMDFRLSLDEFLRHNAKLTASMNDAEFNQYVDEICGVSTVG